MADRSQVEEIKERLDIAEVAKGYLSSMKKSGRNYFALCPFHSEKSPSFSINSDLGIYKCFGCGETGDVITFLEKMEGLDFPEALQLAAEKAGIQLKQNFSPQDKEKRKLKERILSANELAMKFFHYILMEHKNGSEARKYVEGRKLRKEELEKFKIGYAPRSYNSLIKFMAKKGFGADELVRFGLAVERENGIIDKFRTRLMFPIFSTKGEIAGFSGRVIEKEAYGPKYLNSPDTEVFSKSFLLYGLYQAREALRKEDFAILAEGQIDILSSHKLGIENIVAPLGTSLTEPQMKLLKRYCDTIYFCFDTDSAGEKALLRSLEIAHKVGFEVKAVNLGNYGDADELIRDNEKLWGPAVAKAEPVVDNIIRRLLKRIDLTSAKGKAEFAKSILPIIKTLGDKIQQSHYMKKVSVLLDTSEEVIREEFEKAGESMFKVNPVEHSKIIKNTSVLTKEEYLAALLIQNRDILGNYNDYLEKARDLLTHEGILELLSLMETENSIKTLRTKLDEKQQEILSRLILVPGIFYEKMDELELELKRIIKPLSQHKIKEEIKAIKDKIRKMEAGGEDPKKLIKKLNETTKLLNKV